MSDLWNGNEPCRISIKSRTLPELCNSETYSKSEGEDGVMLFNDRRKTRGLPNPDTAVQTYGLNLPGGSKKRTMKEYNARAAVLAVGRAGSIQATEKSKKAPSKLSKKIGGMIMGTGSSNIKTVK